MGCWRTCSIHPPRPIYDADAFSAIRETHDNNPVDTAHHRAQYTRGFGPNAGEGNARKQ